MTVLNAHSREKNASHVNITRALRFRSRRIGEEVTHDIQVLSIFDVADHIPWQAYCEMAPVGNHQIYDANSKKQPWMYAYALIAVDVPYSR